MAFFCQKLPFFKKFNKIVNFYSLNNHNTSFWWIFLWQMSFPIVRFTVNSYFSVLGVKKWLFLAKNCRFLRNLIKSSIFLLWKATIPHNTPIFPWEMSFPSVRFAINSFFSVLGVKKWLFFVRKWAFLV